jgi:hypothetical protein
MTITSESANAKLRREPISRSASIQRNLVAGSRVVAIATSISKTSG